MLYREQSSVSARGFDNFVMILFGVMRMVFRFSETKLEMIILTRRSYYALNAQLEQFFFISLRWNCSNLLCSKGNWNLRRNVNIENYFMRYTNILCNIVWIFLQILSLSEYWKLARYFPKESLHCPWSVTSQTQDVRRHQEIKNRNKLKTPD